MYSFHQFAVSSLYILCFDILYFSTCDSYCTGGNVLEPDDVINGLPPDTLQRSTLFLVAVTTAPCGVHTDISQPQ